MARRRDTQNAYFVCCPGCGQLFCVVHVARSSGTINDPINFEAFKCLKTTSQGIQRGQILLLPGWCRACTLELGFSTPCAQSHACP